MKELLVQPLKHLVEVVHLAARGSDLFSPTHLSQQVRLRSHIVTGNVTAVARGVQRLDWPAIDLGQQDVRDGRDHSVGRAFQQVRNANVDRVLAQANGVVDIGEGVELHLKVGHGRSRAKLTIRLLEDVLEVLAQVATNLP